MLLILTLALVPVLLLLVFISWKDREHPEPVSAMLKGLGFGVLSVFVSLFITMFQEDTPDSFTVAFVGAAMPEEFAKLLMFWLLVRKNKYFDEPIDSIVYAVYVSLGFAAFENVLYLIDDDDLWTVAVSRGLFSVPGHFCFAVAMGFFFGLAHFGQKRKWLFYPLAYIFPVLLHGIYDGLLMFNGDETISCVLIVVWFIFCIFMYRKSIKRIAHLKKLNQPNNWC